MGVDRVPEGEDVVAYLASLPDRPGRWVTGTGVVTDVVLSVLADTGEMPRALPGRLQLLSLSGPLDGPLMATVAVAGGQLEGGRLVRGRSAGVSVVVLEPAASASAPAAAPTARSAAPEGDDDEAEEVPRYGDRVDHFVFGLCDVMVVREERMKIRDASGGGKLREIHLGAVKVLKPTVEDGRRVFKLARK